MNLGTVYSVCGIRKKKEGRMNRRRRIRLDIGVKFVTAANK
jgi:hypothetical protein